GSLVGVVQRAHVRPEGNVVADWPEQGGEYILDHRHARDDVGDREAARQAAAIDLVGLEPGDVLAVKQNLSAGEREAARNQVEQRRLAGTVRPDDGVAFAPGHIQADATDDRRDAERLVDVPQCERAHYRPPSLAAAGWAAAWKDSASCGPHLRPSSRLPASSTSAISQ